MQLWRRCARDIWDSSLPLPAKLELIVCYFGIRKFATHWVSLGFFCTLVPLSMFTPEVTHLCHLLTICPWSDGCVTTQLKLHVGAGGTFWQNVHSVSGQACAHMKLLLRMQNLASLG